MRAKCSICASSRHLEVDRLRAAGISLDEVAARTGFHRSTLARHDRHRLARMQSTSKNELEYLRATRARIERNLHRAEGRGDFRIIANMQAQLLEISARITAMSAESAAGASDSRPTDGESKPCPLCRGSGKIVEIEGDERPEVHPAGVNAIVYVEWEDPNEFTSADDSRAGLSLSPDDAFLREFESFADRYRDKDLPCPVQEQLNRILSKGENHEPDSIVRAVHPPEEGREPEPGDERERGEGGADEGNGDSDEIRRRGSG